ncbi:type II restriction/modification system DNA methylase subunit YeeA [Algoriphagus boseongensis]|uniref:site-specific DNA-methyltransferase (adenine-specific) n=1 Tax=Algoriphagus boseongensis TaxID=1442587 RepID=A0A4V3D1Y2_9BACT|nr:BREX-1 system adenine-specific DNA-methyltransferase PglX [Algoriphagus boseongensis]TDQ15189.1 type II restriction/modification system DNA methylase subunit YeeA [Algoriphagus boseongensis]
MNTNTLKKFAQEARKKLIAQIGAKLDYVLNTDSVELREKESQVKRLKEEIAKSSKAQVIDKVAYTWFNRLMALRFMDMNDFQPLGVRVISPKDGFTTPELLEEVKQGHIPADLPVKKDKIFDLLDGKIPSPNPQNEVFKELLIGACNHLHKTLPFLFERINDYTDLLLPDDLISDFSIVQDIRDGMSAEDCKEVEIIGWLYQFYISELNEELISSKKQYKKHELAPASQLFTPRWIVEYMVDNTLGQVWTEINPTTRVTDFLKFYIKPSYLDKLKPRKKKSIEEVKFFEPCVGSGHILSYAFDVYHKIYEEEGYDPNEIPTLILTKNLFGVDIDPRAAQLASFVLIMKARKKVRNFFRTIERTNLQPNISYYQDFDFDKKFKSATALGSLIKVEPQEVEDFKIESNSLFTARQEELKKLYGLLGQSYDVVVTNPPYINSSRMEGELKTFVEQNYPDTKTDLFATFIIRCLEFCNEDGLTGYMTPFVWMFISSFEKLRKKILTENTINNLVQLEYSGFESAKVAICTFTVYKRKIPNFFGAYVRLDQFKSPSLQEPKTLEAIKNLESCNYFYRSNQDNFKKIMGWPISGYRIRKSEQFRLFNSQETLKSITISDGQNITANNNKFLRLFWEVNKNNVALDERWRFYAKGGDFRKWWGNLEYVIDWSQEAIKKYKSDNSARIIPEYLRFRKGITWTLLSSKDTAFRLLPDYATFDKTGSSVFLSNDNDLKKILALLNSKVSKFFLSFFSESFAFQIKEIRQIPLKSFDLNEGQLDVLMEISKLDWNKKETSGEFEISHLLKNKGIELEDTFLLYQQIWTNKFLRNHKIEEKLNFELIRFYELENDLDADVPLEEITILQDELDREALKAQNARLERDPVTGLVSDYSGIELKFDAKEVFAQFISYAVGCMFGRYSLDKEGLILANQGETLEDYLRIVRSSGVETSFLPDEDNIIPVLDDEWFEDDIVSRFKEFLRVTFGKENLEKNLAFVESAIGKDIRKYFVKDFYTDHIQRYKKRPIYWMFSSPNGSFNVLIYMHRYTQDTLSKILNDYLNQYREKLRARVEHLDQVIVSGSSTEQTKAAKEKDKIRAVLLELQEYERDILYPLATERIGIDLDEGVLVNYNKFGKAIKEVSGLNDKKAKAKVREFDWIDTSTIR